jgi:hypothetical protein
MVSSNHAEELEAESFAEDDGVEEDLAVFVERLAEEDFPKVEWFRLHGTP